MRGICLRLWATLMFESLCSSVAISYSETHSAVCHWNNHMRAWNLICISNVWSFDRICQKHSLSCRRFPIHGRHWRNNVSDVCSLQGLHAETHLRQTSFNSLPSITGMAVITAILNLHSLRNTSFSKTCWPLLSSLKCIFFAMGVQSIFKSMPKLTAHFENHWTSALMTNDLKFLFSFFVF